MDKKDCMNLFGFLLSGHDGLKKWDFYYRGILDEKLGICFVISYGGWKKLDCCWRVVMMKNFGFLLRNHSGWKIFWIFVEGP